MRTNPYHPVQPESSTRHRLTVPLIYFNASLLVLLAVVYWQLSARYSLQETDGILVFQFETHSTQASGEPLVGHHIIEVELLGALLILLVLTLAANGLFLSALWIRRRTLDLK